MTTTEHQASGPAKRRPLAPEVRRAAARMILAANKANREEPDPRVVAIAEGRD